MLYLVGLGLGGPDDITVKGLEIVKKAKRVYLDGYTSVMSCGREHLEKTYGCKINLLHRTEIEDDEAAEKIFEGANIDDVVFLVVGDPLGATTHTDLILRARKKNISYKIVHNASIMNAVSSCGLQLYRFGKTVSIPYWTDDWRPESFIDGILCNKQNDLHTLCLLGK